MRKAIFFILCLSFIALQASSGYAKEAVSGSIVKIDDTNFKKKTRKGVVVVYFYNERCAMCKIFAPIISKIADEMKKSVQFYKIDTDNAVKTAKNNKIYAVPTTILFNNGEEVTRDTGLLSREQLLELIEN